MFDTHVHLDQQEFSADVPEVLARSRAAGVEAVICAGISALSSRAALDLALKYPEVFAAVGIQPNYVGEAEEDDWDRIVEMTHDSRVVAVGETGLDCHWDFAPLQVQRDYFGRHLQLAAKRNLPLIIHCRQAEADVLEMLRAASAKAPLRGVMHAFSGDVSMLDECIQLGLYVSFAGPITYKNKKFDKLREAARTVPEDKLLIETDSPYLVPHPLRGKQKRNEPELLVHTAEALAALRGVTPAQLADATSTNTCRLFGLPAS